MDKLRMLRLYWPNIIGWWGDVGKQNPDGPVHCSIYGLTYADFWRDELLRSRSNQGMEDGDNG